jgi:hypothetical protein
MPAISSFSSNPSYALEKAIRPFTDAPPRARTGRTDPVQDTSVAVISWTCRTNVEVTTVQALGFRLTNPDEQTETYRVTHTKRVENPNDPNQFVDVEQISRLDTKGSDGVRHRTNFAE